MPFSANVGIESDVEQAAMAHVQHGRRAQNLARIGAGANMLQPAGTLGHQEGTVGQQRDRPRHVERAGGSDRGSRALGEHEARLVVRPGGPGLGRRTAERQSGQEQRRFAARQERRMLPRILYGA